MTWDDFWYDVLEPQWLDLVILSAFFVVAMIGFLRKSPWIKYVTLAASLVYLGLYKSTMLSVVDIFRLFTWNLPAFREIYYNDGFTWEIDPNDQPGDGRFDLQTVALHEAGHGLSQAHFGAAFTTGNGKLHVAPLAVMNAGYIFGQQQLAGSDNGGHCSNWANWPTN